MALTNAIKPSEDFKELDWSSSSIEWCPQLSTTNFALSRQLRISAAVSKKSDNAGISADAEELSVFSSASSSIVENLLFLVSWLGDVSDLDSTNSPGLNTIAESCQEMWQAKWMHSAWVSWARIEIRNFNSWNIWLLKLFGHKCHFLQRFRKTRLRKPNFHVNVKFCDKFFA